MKNFLSVYSSALLVACAVSLVVTAPVLHLFFANQYHLAVNSHFAVGVIALGALFLGILIFSVLALSKKNRFSALTASLFLASAVSLILQFHFAADYFPDYTTMPMELWERLLFFAVHFIILALPFIPAVIYRQKLSEYSGKTALVIILVQLSYVASAAANSENIAADDDFDKYTFSEQEKFTFAREDNVILLVVDSMGRNIAYELFSRYPELSEVLDGFTLFDQLHSPIPRTMYAVPAMLSGIDHPHNGKGEPDDIDHLTYLNRVCRSENSIIMQLRHHGFKIEGYPFLMQTISFAPDVIDNSEPVTFKIQLRSVMIMFRETAKQMLMYPLKKVFFRTEELPFVAQNKETDILSSDFHDRVFYNSLRSKFRVGEDKKSFKYLHLHGAHTPVCVNENLQEDSFPLRVKQLRGSFKAIELLLKKLKESGLWKNSTIIITGDHSEVYSSDTVCFVKMRNSDTGQLCVNSNKSSVSDICGTIVNEYVPHLKLASLDFSETAKSKRVDAGGTVLQFSPWKELKHFEIPFSTEIFDCGFYLENNQLVIESFVAKNETAKRLLLLARNELSGKLFCSEILSPGSFRYIRSCDIGLPEGYYRFELCVEYANTPVGEERFMFWYRRLLGRLFKVEKGRCTIVYAHDVPYPEQLGVDGNIQFKPLGRYPMLNSSMPLDVRNGKLLLPNCSTLTIKLAPSAGNSILDINITGKPVEPCFINVSADNGFYVKEKIPNITGRVISIPLGIMPEAGELYINFEDDKAEQSQYPLFIRISEIRRRACLSYKTRETPR